MGADVNSPCSDGKTPLHEAVLKGNETIVECLLTNGANVHIKTSSGECPLITAVYKDDSNLIDLLMRCGAHLASADKRLINEMMTLAVKNASVRRLECLRSAGVNLDMTDELLQSPLHKAVLYNCPEVAQFLVDCGAVKTRKDILSFSPIDYAERLNRDVLVKILQ